MPVIVALAESVMEVIAPRLSEPVAVALADSVMAEVAELETRPPLLSLVLPVHNQADHIRAIVESYVAGLALLPLRYEIILVVNGSSDGSLETCRGLEARREAVRVIELDERGWGRSVRAGLASAEGDLLCFTNSARTTREILTLMLAYALAYPVVVLKANRRIRESRRRRARSALRAARSRR